MASLIDTSVLVTVERHGLPPSHASGLSGAGGAALATITVSELLFGAHRAGSAARRERREAFIESVIRGFPLVPFDLLSARVHARLGAQLAGAGQIIGAHDLIIAATAVAHGYSVLTDNLREFERVPGLVVHKPNW